MNQLSMLFRFALRRFGHRAVVHSRASSRETWLSLMFALDVGLAIFEVATAEKGAKMSRRIGDEEYLLTGTGPVYYATPRDWLTTLWLAIAARDEQALQLLAAVPAETLRTESVPLEYLHDMVRMFQLFLRREPGVDMALNAALRNSAPSQLPEGIREYAMRISFPQMTLFHYLFQEDAEQQFNDALAEALRLHNTYWTADAERHDSPLGYLALGPLALAIVARDTGTTIEVESEYMPANLLDGTARLENA